MDKIEAAARALLQVRYANQRWEDFDSAVQTQAVAEARAVLMEFREPGEKMIRAGNEFVVADDAFLDVGQLFTAMVDAELSEPEPQG